MAQKRTGLGRGIGSLIPTTAESNRPVDVFFPQSNSTELLTVPGAELAALNPNDIVPNPQQPRSDFRDADLDELIHSVREFGVLQPIVVRRLDNPGSSAQYELIMGERRLRASKAAGLETIPAIIRDTADENMLRDALLENLHRSELNPLEEASAYQQLMNDFGITQEQLAGKIGRSRPQISNTIRLLKLPERVQQRVAAGVLSAGHARAILASASAVEMEALADKIVNQGLSVREVESLVSDDKVNRGAKKRPIAGSKQDQLSEIASEIGDLLNTRVKVTLGAKKGQIVIDFATIQDLNRILKELKTRTFGS
ncbi:MAG: ParB/RepB/Spo0J family partition protein [Microbacteriaceae bacterium]